MFPPLVGVAEFIRWVPQDGERGIVLIVVDVPAQFLIKQAGVVLQITRHLFDPIIGMRGSRRQFQSRFGQSLDADIDQRIKVAGAGGIVFPQQPIEPRPIFIVADKLRKTGAEGGQFVGAEIAFDPARADKVE